MKPKMVMMNYTKTTTGLAIAIAAVLFLTAGAAIMNQKAESRITRSNIQTAAPTVASGDNIVYDCAEAQTVSANLTLFLFEKREVW
jgi:hypothetical protein